MTNEGASEPIVRHAARVVLFDAAGRVLLFPFSVPLGDGRTRKVWITPGGGLEAGESHEDGAARELWEETGMRLPLGPCVWTRSHLLRWGGRVIEQRERYFVASAHSSAIDTANWTDEERIVLGEHRWWSSAEIAASWDYFAPRSLAEAMLPLLAGDYPAQPIDVGV